MLAELTNNVIFHYAIVFSRIGAIFLFIPGFGESYVTVRARLALGLTTSLIIFPLVSPNFPPVPEDFIKIALVLIGEVTIGIFIGLLMRIIQSILHITGMKIAFMTGLSTATLFDANQSTQGSVIGGFLSVIGITLFLTAGLHEIVFIGLKNSYETFEAGAPIPFDSLAQTTYQTFSESFLIAFRISTPMIIAGLMLYLGAGLMGRLMPSMQVFFVLLPIQIYVGLLFVGLSLSTMMMIYISFFEEKLLMIFN
jgi:flagellar biosynthetic protein FliR